MILTFIGFLADSALPVCYWPAFSSRESKPPSTVLAVVCTDGHTHICHILR